MAVNRETLRLTRELRVAVGTEADDATRALTTAWIRAWDQQSGQWRGALREVAALAVELERWPYAWELARIERLRRAIDTADAALVKLERRTDMTVTKAAAAAIAVTVATEPLILASQLPTALAVAAAVSYAAALTPNAVDLIAADTNQRITTASRSLSADASTVMRRHLIQGVPLGPDHRETTQRMVARVEGAFNGGLGRAATVARTETLDAYRDASRASHVANRDVVADYRWLATLDTSTCGSCWSMHGTVFPVDEFGPFDHRQGRCARVAVLRPWSEMGIAAAEPPDRFPDARARFDALSEADQLKVLGPGRLELLRSGRIRWDQLATRRENPGWRTTYVPTSLAELQRQADRLAV